MPKISVIIPVYKTAKYMRKCIDSVINQTFSDIEIILVSDGPDEEHQICDEYAKKDNRIKVLKDIGKGLGGARNAGVKIAKGEYIAFVDSDDWVEPDTYKEAYNTASAFCVDLVLWYAKTIPGQGFKDKNFLDSISNYHKIKISGLKELNDDIICESTVTAWNKLFKKSIIKENNILFPENSMYEDNEFFYKYCTFAKQAYYLDRYFYNYFQRNDSLMQSLNVGNRQSYDCIKVYRSVYNWYKDRNALFEHRKLLCEFFKDPLYKFQLAEDKKSVKRELIKLAKEIDNDILGYDVIDFVKNNKFYKIPFLNVPKYEFGNKILKFKYSNERAILRAFGVTFSVNVGNFKKIARIK